MLLVPAKARVAKEKMAATTKSLASREFITMNTEIMEFKQWLCRSRSEGPFGERFRDIRDPRREIVGNAYLPARLLPRPSGHRLSCVSEALTSQNKFWVEARKRE